MDARHLHEAVRTQPFQPFTIHLSNGRSYEVKHPEQIIITPRVCYVGVGGHGEGIYQDVAVLSNIHINAVEPIKPRKAG